MSHLYHLPNGLAMCRRPVGAVSAIASLGAGAKPTDVDNRLLVCRDAAVNLLADASRIERRSEEGESRRGLRGTP